MTQIRLLVAGDFCPIARLAAPVSRGEAGAGPTAGEIRGLAREADLFVVNLECPLTSAAPGLEKAGHLLSASPDAASFLRGLGVALVTLANNHILDAGEVGLEETLSACVGVGIETTGAGLSLESAAKIYYRRSKGRTLAVVNMAEREYSCAGAGRGGANPFDAIAAVRAIREARCRAAHVVVIVHGGLEGLNFPSPESVRSLRFLAEEGATAVLRHHAHSVQGWELWRGVPIFYGLGNFLFDWPSRLEDHRWHEGVIADLRIGEDDRCVVEVHSFDQCREEPVLRMHAGPERERFLERLAVWSAGLSDEALLEEEWAKVGEARKRDYLSSLTVPHRLLARVAGRLGLLERLVPSRRARMILENYLRCDAHREALLSILERDRMGRGGGSRRRA